MKSFFSLTVLLIGALMLPFNSIIKSGLEIGDIAPDFELENIDGAKVSLESIKKEFQEKKVELKGHIVIFTCNTCPYAQMYEDRIQTLHEKMAPEGWPVVAIQPNDPKLKPGDSMENMQQRAKDKGFTFPYLMDVKQDVFPAYGATRTPHVFLLDVERKVHYIGAIDDNPQNAEGVNRKFIELAIAAVESGSEPDPDYTKAIGCGIKSKK